MTWWQIYLSIAAVVFVEKTSHDFVEHHLQYNTPYWTIVQGAIVSIVWPIPFLFGIKRIVSRLTTEKGCLMIEGARGLTKIKIK